MEKNGVVRTTINLLARTALPAASAARAQKPAVSMKKQNIRLKKMVTKTTLVRSEQMRKTKVRTPMNNNQNPEGITLAAIHPPHSFDIPVFDIP